MKLHKSFILFSFLFLFHADTFAQNCLWARQANLENWGLHTVSTLDKFGNTFLAGRYTGPAQFDSIQFPGILSTKGWIYLAKYDPAGNLKWVIRDSSNNAPSVSNICTDDFGNIFMTGAVFGNGRIGGVLVNTPLSDPPLHFISKYDSSGAVKWNYFIPSHAPSSILYIKSLTADHQGNLFFTGVISDSITVGSYHLNSQNGALYPGKMDQYGSLSWIQQFQGNAYLANEIELRTDANNNIILAAGFAGLKDSTSLSIGTIPLITNGQVQTFIAKFDVSGNPLWAIVTDSLGATQLKGMNTDLLGNVYISGNWSDSISTNFFTRKYNSAGQGLWRLISSGGSNGIASTSELGNTYALIGVYMHPNFIFDNIQLNQNIGGIFVKIDSSGHTRWYSPMNGFYYYWSKISAGRNGTVLLSSSLIKFESGNSLLFNNNKLMDAVALFLDSEYVNPNNCIVSGRVINDRDSDCIYNNNDQLLPGFGVVALPGPYYGFTDSLGNYQMNTDTGVYAIKPLVPYNHGLTSSMLRPSTGYYTIVNNSSGTSTNGIDFGGNYNVCTLLNLSYEASNLSCDSVSERTVTVCNYGRDTAWTPQLIIKYPGDLVPVQSSIPWNSFTLPDSILTINLPNLYPDSCISLSISDSVMCNGGSIGYYTVMTIARVVPINLCYPSDSNYCSVTLFDGTPLTVGIHELHKSKSLNIYPNPSNDRIWINLENSLKNNLAFIITDLSGREVLKKENVHTSITEVDISTLSPGIYILHVISTENYMTKKIVVR